MNFNPESEKEYFINLWKERKSSGLSHSAQDWDRRSDSWVKRLNDIGRTAEREKQRVEATGAYLRSRGLLTENEEVIDIGCGPGRFVCEFAKTAGKVTGADISPKMCSYGEEYASSLGLENTEFIPCDFIHTDIDEAGWNKKYDLVFSSITPAMSSYESLIKAEKMSRKYCFQSNYVNVTNSLTDEVLKEVLPADILPVPRDRRSFYVLFNILLLEGRKPETFYYSETDDLRTQVDDALVEKAFNFAPRAPKEEYFEKVRSAMLRRTDNDGFINIRREWHYGWILWDVRNRL